MSGALGLGVIGLGSVFEPYSAAIRDLRAEGRLRVAHTCDAVPERAGEVERFLYEGAPFSSDYRDVIADPAVEAVLILTAMPHHGPIALEALRAGKHVLVEKPMAVDLETAGKIVEEADRGNSVLVCAPSVILSPTYQAIWKRAVHNGEIGRIDLARGRYGWSGPTWGKWYYQAGGGPVFDLGVYNLMSLTGLLGPVERVAAFAGTAEPVRAVDGEEVESAVWDNYQIMLDFGSACLAVVTTGFTMQSYRSPALELYGSEGVVQMMGDDWGPDGYEMWTNRFGAWSVHAEADPGWDWTAGLRHLVDAVDGAPQLMAPRHAYHVLEVMLKADEAARTGEAQTVSSTLDPIPYDPDSIALEGAFPAHDHRIIREEQRTPANGEGA